MTEEQHPWGTNDGKGRVVAFIVSGPTGSYDVRIPLDDTDYDSIVTAKKQANEHCVDDQYAIGIEFENGEMAFEW
jgi:hypothetical protein